MAPECRRGEPATPRSDVFSLGAVLYELCTGTPPGAERTTRELLASDPALGRIIDRCIRKAPAERFASAKELLAALKPLCPEMRAPPEGNPYRGLCAFDEEHSELFFGRDSEVGKVLERLRRERFILVAGDSGVGKSSLCRAGILPRVREGAIDPRGRASVLRIVPGRRPIRALAEALAPLRDGQAEPLAHWLRNEPAALPRTLPAIPGISVILLFVDQLEEVVTVADRDEAAAFMTALAALAASDAPARILAAVRGDFFTRIAELPGLGESAPVALFLLRPMAPERLRQTVVEPAQKAGIAFESAEMIDSLVDDAARAGGGLPLLQFTMAELWDGRDVEARRIPATALTRIGGVAGALARHADDVISHLLPDQRAAARRVLLRLITPQGTRTRASAHALTGDQAEARAALEALVQGRLVVAHESEGGATEYALAHETLLTDWGTLREWIEADGDRRQIRARIAGAAAEWERLGRRADTLWDRRRLGEASRVDPAELDQGQRAFLDASARRVARSKRLRILLLAAGPVLVAIAIAAVRWRTQAEIDAQATARAARGLARLSEARQIDVRATRSREEALRTFAASKTADDWQGAETAWVATIEERSSADAAYESAEVAFE